ncbi:MAG: hypothetical protein ACQERD_10620 [Campylobacterota bacterium]
MEEIESFDSWNSKKKDIHTNKNRIHFRQGEIWFVHIGQNIGYEVYGKGEDFYKLTPQDRGEATLTKSEQRINKDIIPNEPKEVKYADE